MLYYSRFCSSSRTLISNHILSSKYGLWVLSGFGTSGLPDARRLRCINDIITAFSHSRVPALISSPTTRHQDLEAVTRSLMKSSKPLLLQVMPCTILGLFCRALRAGLSISVKILVQRFLRNIFHKPLRKRKPTAK